jgi:hypothetical protein
MGKKPIIRVTVRPAENPPSKERLGEIAERLLELLAEEDARRFRKLREAKHDDAGHAA